MEKNKIKFSNDEIDFNNPDSFKKIISQISKQKGKSSIKDIPKKVISFVTGNIKLVAIIAIYFLSCGLALNIHWICKLISLLF